MPLRPRGLGGSGGWVAYPKNPGQPNRVMKKLTANPALRRWQVCCLSGLILCGTAGTDALRAHGDEPRAVVQTSPAAQLEDWVGQLGAVSYHERRAAMLRLQEAGLTARPALLAGIKSENLEVRTTCQRLLGALAGSEQEAELERLLYGYTPGHVYELPGWERFRKASGDSPAHRALYVQLARRHGAGLRWLDSLTHAPRGSAEEIATVPETLGIDVQRLSAGDECDWAFVLLAASQPQVRHTPTLVSQVYGGLLEPRVSQKFLSEGEDAPVFGLLKTWVAAQDDPIPRRSLVQVCLRYGLRQHAVTLAKRILQHGGAPSASQYALLTLARLDDPAIEDQLTAALGDQRVCHTWQVVGNSRRTVKTEVRDTALALLLRRSGLDPREFGFSDLQADPDTIYRDFSIGFANDEERDHARTLAMAALQH